MDNTVKQDIVYEEKLLQTINGLGIIVLNTLLLLAALAAVIVGGMLLDYGITALGIILLVIGILYLSLGWIVYCGVKVLQPNEALVLTLFGRYYGVLKGEGIFFVNPFCVAVNPASGGTTQTKEESPNKTSVTVKKPSKKISLKALTLSNESQKINDLMGNPIIIGINVIWKVENTAKAVFNVDNYAEFLSIQCDTALRNIVRLYPYDVAEEDEKSLRGSSQEIAENLKNEIQSRVAIAGLSIMEARITHLSYAPEIAAVMLQRQQASAVIDARKMIVDGAVGMVEMALARLSEKNIVELDDERKAQMASNLMVVLCSSKDTQPIVNSGSIY